MAAWVLLTYSLVSLTLLLRYGLQFRSLLRVLLKGERYKKDGVWHVHVTGQIPPFSFFNHIIYDPNAHKPEELAQILEHEAVHCKQAHSWDLLLADLTKIVLWFNPLMWLYKKAIQQNLEYLADRGALHKVAASRTYQHTLLKVSVQPVYASITTNFYNSLIKNRIIMINRRPSTKRNQLKVLLVLPLLAVFLMAFNTKTEYVLDTSTTILNEPNTIETSSIEEAVQAQEPIKVTIDKNTTRAELDALVADLKEEGVELSYSRLRYNDQNEIIRISLKLKVERDGNRSISESSFNNDADDPIDPIMIMHDSSTNTTFMGDPSKQGRKKLRRKGDNVWVQAKKDGKRKEKRKVNVWTSEGEGYDDIEIIRENGETRIMLNGKEVSKEELKEHRIKMIKKRRGEVIIEELDEEDGQTIIIEEIEEEDEREEDEEEEMEIEEENVFIKVKTKEDKDDQEEAIFVTTNSMNNPLFIVDGKKVKNEKRGMRKLDPDTIESIEVIKGDKALEKYGDEGKNGVVVVTTKKKKE